MNDVGRLADYLGHILEAIGRVDAYTDGLNEAEFLAETLVQDAVLRNLEIVGEASRNIERRFPQFAADHPELPLALAYQMRNVVAHGYFEVDMEIVWKTVKRDLPALAGQVRTVLSNIR